AFAADGKTLVAAGEDKIVKLWDVAAGTVKATLPEQKQAIELLAFSSDGKTLAICGEGDKTKPAEVSLWDVASRTARVRLAANLEHVGALAFAPDGKTLVTGGRASSLVQVWNAATGSELFRQQALPTKQVSMVTMRNPGAQFPVIQQRVTQGAAGIRTLAFSRDSKQLALGLADGTLRLWDALT